MTTPSAGALVSAKTICLALKIGSFGNSKQASLAPVQVDADKSLLTLNKRLLDSPELQALQRFDRELAGKIRALAFSSLFKGGVYLLPLGLVGSVNQLLEEAQLQRATLVETACAMYATRVTETTERLGVTADARDYPSMERFRASFYLEYSYVTFETPSKLKAISAELFQQEVAKAQTRLESVAEECQQAMRAGLLQLVDHLSDRLTPTEDGKHKRLNTSTIKNLNEFLSLFELRNVTDDAELGAIVMRAREVMSGVDHGTLKHDELVRQFVQEELGKLSTALEPLIVDKTRAIALEEDPVG